LKNTDHNDFVCPIRKKVISKFGPRGKRIHTGTDIKCSLGDSIFAAFDGKVRIAKIASGYGYMVLVRHYNGLETLYGHLSKITVNTNEMVKAGDLIGLGGRTGRATTEHLHFETRYLSEPFNPEIIIDFENGILLQDTLCITKKTFEIPRKQNTVTSNTTGTSRIYYVKKGDTLSSIARKHGTTVAKICSLNHISAKKVLKVGAKLIIK
jgi:hypothetical protein